ncbi:MAG: transposase [Deltaproteobacteria bacterium]|nr:transposase [Deltaproteobacteria bacterium]
MNRGLDRRAIVEDDEDADAFFDLLSEAHKRWQIRCHAACLMTNHYHLLLEDVAGLLSRAMRHIDGVFTQRFNRRYGRDGALMKGRYRSQLVDHDGYLLEVVRYIHANPVDAGMVSRGAEYPWSSHRWYLARTAPAWLTRDVVLAHFGRTTRGVKAFDAFVHERVPDTVRSALAPERGRSVVGSEAFVEAWKARTRLQGARQRDREIPEARRLAALPTEQVISAACEVFSCSRRKLVAGVRGSRRRARELALLACREFTGATNAATGEVFGIAAATVPTAARRARAELARDDEFRRQYQRLTQALQSKSQAAT